MLASCWARWPAGWWPVTMFLLSHILQRPSVTVCTNSAVSPFSPANWAELLPVDHQERSAFLLLWHYPCPIHTCLGFHSRELKEGLPPESYSVLWAGPHWPLHYFSSHQLPAPATGGEPPGCAAQRHLPQAKAAPGVHQAHDAFLDDPRPAW